MQRFYLFFLAGAIAPALSGCPSDLMGENDRAAFMSAIGQQPATASNSSTPVEQAPAEQLIDYNRGGGVTIEQVKSLGLYAKGQSQQAMRSLLGTPNRVSANADVFYVRNSGDVAVAGRRLIVLYQADQSCNYTCSTAYDWYLQ